MLNLPTEIWRQIYEYDSTYREQYKVLMVELIFMYKVDCFFSSVHLDIILFQEVKKCVCRLLRKSVMQRILRNKKLRFRKRDTKLELLNILTRFYFSCTLLHSISYGH